MITPLKRIAALAVYVETGAPGDEEFKTLPVMIEFPFDPGLPGSEFVEFIKDQGRFFRRPSRGEELTAILSVVPVEIAVLLSVEERFRQGGFPDLAGPGEKNHLFRKVLKDGCFRITWDQHGIFYAIKQNKLQYILLFRE